MPSSHSLQGAILLLVCAWASIIHPHRASGALPGLEGYVAVPQVSPGVGEYLITLDRRLILNANEGRIQVIDLKTGTKLRTFGFEGRSVSAYGVSTDSATLDARLKTFDDQGVPIETGGELVAWRLVDGQRITQPSPPPVMLAPPDWQAWQKLHPNIKPGLDPRYGIEALPNNRDSEEERYALLDFKTGERRTFALLRDLSCVNDPQTFAYDGINLVLAHGGGEGGVTKLDSSLFVWDGTSFQRKWFSCQETDHDLSQWVSDKSYAVSYYSDAPIILWNLETARERATITGLEPLPIRQSRLV